MSETDRSGSTTRTTTTAYDGAGRKTHSAVESTEGHALPAVESTYDASTGLPATTKTTEDGTTRTVSRTYDSLGRVVSYTDADGNTSTTTYDLRGRVVTTNDGKGSQTRGYDATTGDLTQLADSALGTIAGTYDADGKLVRQDLPSGLSQRTAYDETGDAVRLRYTKPGSTGSSFPSTPILDDFDRADESPLAGNWAGPAWTGDGQGRVTSNQATSWGTGWGGSYWNAASFTGSAEVFATSAQDGAVYLYLHWDPGSRNGYALDYNARGDSFRIVRIANGFETTLVSAAASLAAGDSFGLTKRGDALQAWRRASGGVWAPLGASVQDGTYNSGRIAFEVASNSTLIDDFGGGAVDSTFPTTPVLDDFERADESPLAGNWAGPAWPGDGQGRLTQNQATSWGTGWGGSYWNAASFAGDAEVFASSPQDGSVWLYLHWDPVARSGYALDYSGASNAFRIVRLTNGAQTTLRSGSAALAAGDSFGLSRRGTTLQAWRRPADGAWQALGAGVEDSTHASGRIAFEVSGNSTFIDGFGGGEPAACASNCQYSQSVMSNIHGQWINDDSNLTQRAYGYDKAGRLTHVEETTNGSCRVRDYDYDANSNRRSVTSRPPKADGACDTLTSGATTTSTYDEADRILTTQGDPYTYDALGRTTTSPASGAGGAELTAKYHTDDRVRSLTQGATTKTYGLDPLRRVRTEATANATTATHHYADDSDSPAWIAEGDDGSRWTRNITGLDGNLIATHNNQTGVQAAVANLHGDLIGDSGSEGLTAVQLADEFGRPNIATTRRYAWLGSKRRATALSSGVVMMGQRVYAPGIGRFLQVDPVIGGSATDYDYANQDPVNRLDLDGRQTTGRYGCKFRELRLDKRQSAYRHGLRWSFGGGCRSSGNTKITAIQITVRVRQQIRFWRDSTVPGGIENFRVARQHFTHFPMQTPFHCTQGKRYFVKASVTVSISTAGILGSGGTRRRTIPFQSGVVTCP